jgi:hypothetical protein
LKTIIANCKLYLMSLKELRRNEYWRDLVISHAEGENQNSNAIAVSAVSHEGQLRITQHAVVVSNRAGRNGLNKPSEIGLQLAEKMKRSSSLEVGNSCQISDALKRTIEN